MTKKQSYGLIVAAVIFVVVGVISVLTNTLSSSITKKQDSNKSEFGTFMDQLSGGSDIALADMPTNKDFVAIVPIEGTIQESSGTQGLAQTGGGYNHDLLMKYVDKLIDNKNNKAIVLRLDTPGGAVYQADELYLKLMEYKEKTGRPIYAYMESMCCSGGVYLASSADEQYANRNTTTGSIGVIISGYDMSELYKKLGIKEQNIVSAKNKDMGSSGKPMTAEQKAIYQALVDEAYEQFVGIVAEARNMSVEDVKKLADGRIYTASQAVDNGLIDGIKTSDEFDAYIKEVTGVSEFYRPSDEASYLSKLFGSAKDLKPKSEAEILVDLVDRFGSGVPMYYARPFGE
ncbi:MAG: signal peptide peptidase SppA [Lachnospiraceae bacterium]|nr:signal peptide peptidase SppA [Lachnospiraceae bacterium]